MDLLLNTEDSDEEEFNSEWIESEMVRRGFCLAIAANMDYKQFPAISSAADTVNQPLGKQWGFNDHLKRLFLHKFAKSKLLAASAVQCGVHPATVSKHARQDKVFGVAKELAASVYQELILQEMHRRAVDGVDKPVFYMGGVVGFVKEYSDRLLVKLAETSVPDFKTLPAGAPTIKGDTYIQHNNLNVNSNNNVQNNTKIFSDMDAESLDMVEKLLEKQVERIQHDNKE